MTLNELNQLSTTEFVEISRPLLEHCEWALTQLAEHRPFHSGEELQDVLAELIYQADEILQLEALRAHPKLGVGSAQPGFSQEEQQQAGLKQLTYEELELFKTLNEAYEQKFGFPFVITVTGLTKDEILNAMQTRLNSETDLEFDTAMKALVKIAQLRVHKLINT